MSSEESDKPYKKLRTSGSLRKMEEPNSSLIPFPGPSSGLTIDGMKHQLENANKLILKERKMHEELILKEREKHLEFLLKEREKNNNLLKELRDSVECPVCFNIPRSPPIPCCRNGHFICQTCKSRCNNNLCPTCRASQTDCVSQIGAKIIQHIEHACNFRDHGCEFMGLIGDMQDHEDNCGYHIVRCPNWACGVNIPASNLTSHVIGVGCGNSHLDKPLPFREKMFLKPDYADDEGNLFLKPTLLQFDNITFYLQVERCGKSKDWYFYIQTEGSPKDCMKYATMIKVSKTEFDGNSIIYNGVVCPVDVKGAVEIEASGAVLLIRDHVMKNFFVDEDLRFLLEVDIFKSEEWC